MEASPSRQLLLECCKGNRNKVLSLLQSKSASANDQYLNQVPIIEASRSGHNQVVKILLDHGAQVDLKDYTGWTALMVAS